MNLVLSVIKSFLNNLKFNLEKIILHYRFDESDDIIQNNVKDQSKFENHGKFGSGVVILKVLF